MFEERLLVVDVGAAPGGWSSYLAALNQVYILYCSEEGEKGLILDAKLRQGKVGKEVFKILGF